MRKVRNFLIPHKDNGHIPHIFSEKICVGLIVFVVLIYGSSLISTLTIRSKDQIGAVYASVLVDLTNEARAETELPNLQVNPVLAQAAAAKVNDMVQNDYFAHTSPTGVTPWYWFSDVGYKFAYAGENLAVGFNESEQVNSGWLNSPTHRANILSANFTEVGIAVADGYRNGKPTTYVVQMFGKPKAQKAPVLAVKTEEVPINIVEETQTSNVLAASSQEVPTKLTTVFEDKYLAITRNDTPEEIIEDAVINDISNEIPITNVVAPVELSTVTERALVSQPLLVQYIFTIIMILALFSLIVFLGLEFRSGHMKHALYGIILIAITAGLSFANQAMIVVPKLFY